MPQQCQRPDVNKCELFQKQKVKNYMLLDKIFNFLSLFKKITEKLDFKKVHRR